MLDAAKGLGMTVGDLLSDGEVVKKVREEFNKKK